MQDTGTSTKNLTLLETVNIILRWRKAIGVIVAAAVVIGLAVAFLLPKYYYSYGTVKSSSVQRTGLGSLMGSINSIEQLVGGFADLGMPAGGSDLQTFVKILGSRRVCAEVVRKFNLMEEYHTGYMEDAIEALIAKTHFKVDIEASILHIGVFDRDPARARDIAQYFIEMLNKVNIELNITRAKSTREFVEARYNEAKTDLRRAEDSLRGYQQRSGVYLLEEQARSAIESAAKLKSELTLKEIEMGIMQNQMQGDQPEIARLEEEIKEMNKKLGELFYGLEKPAPDGKGTRLFVPLSAAPSVGLEYLRLYRDVRIGERLIEVLLPLFEKAKIEEKQDTPTLLLIDSPFVPEKKAKPFRMLIVLSAFALGVVLAAAYVLLAEYAVRVERNDPDQYRKLRALEHELSGKIRSVLGRRKKPE